MISKELFAGERLKEVRKFGIFGAQLALLLVVLRQFQIESNAFLRIAVLAFGGFSVHYFLPIRFRPPFFLVLSLAGIGIVFGLTAGAWLIAIGLILIGICHLPLPVSARLFGLLLAGGGLALLRVDWVHAPWSQAIWPILGSMFMFRLMIYLYDISHDESSWSLPQTLSYFFMLPNVCFPLFPVVDYKTFRRTYYSDEPHKIYQTGIEWMTRGVIHLILYRVVYYHLTIAPAEVTTPGDFVQFVVTSFLLYLRISGQFHLIVGMLCLFGFNLPETHHLYYLAASFTDFWRRINIYWKDFMMKIFYYPVYFWLRTKGTTFAMVFSTVVVFFATWLLHAYQWFWLRGSVLFTGPDVVFWGVLAILVVLNSLYELRYGRERTLSKHAMSISSASRRTLKTVGTFSVICILWSLWQSETVFEWFSLWESVGKTSAMDIRAVPILLVAGVVAGGIAASKERILQTKSLRIIFVRKTPLSNTAVLVFLALLGIQGVYVQLGPTAATFINSLRSGRLSRLDVAMLEKGYYENLNRVERFNSQLWELYMNRPATWLDVGGTGLERFTGDFLQKELVPSFVAFTSHGPVRTNRWAMRDKEYEKVPPPNTYRVAVLGASSVMGWGVGDGETFEAMLEKRLNAEIVSKSYANYEILNFAVPGYQPLQQLVVLDKAFSFQPSALFYVATGREGSRSVAYLAEVASKGIPIPYDYLRDVLRRAEISPRTPEAVATRHLLPFRDEILGWTYQNIVARCRERKIVPLLIFLPQVEDGRWKEETPTILRIAREVGFTVLDLSDVYGDRDLNSIRLAEWDNHPNAKGHELVASRLYLLLKEKEDQIFSARP